MVLYLNNLPPLPLSSVPINVFLQQIYSNIMNLNQLTALSPIDGRYRSQLQHLDEYFSEYALIKYRVIIEIEYFLFLAEKKFFKIEGVAETKAPVKGEAKKEEKLADIKILLATANVAAGENISKKNIQYLQEYEFFH